MPPTYVTSDFLSQRIRETEKIIREVQLLADSHAPGDFLIQPDPASWSAAQVIEHLNSYNRYYLPAIRHALEKKPLPVTRERYHAGWLGAYFAALMMPQPGGRVKKKMQSPRDHRPAPALDVVKVLEEFKSGQELLLAYMRESAKTDIGAIRIPVSISPLIRLKLGDTFHFLVAHQLRHLEQVKRIFPILMSLKLVTPPSGK
jgi:hypothetical protein